MSTGIALALLLAVQAPPAATPQESPKLVLYTQTRLTGDSRSILAAYANLEAIDFDNKARSVRVVAGQWEICAEKRFQKCVIVDANVPDLETVGLSHKISSVRLLQPRTTVPPTVAAPAAVTGPAPGIVFFDKTGFRGGTLALDQARGNLAALTARVESVRVTAGTWQLCTGMNYTGNCVVVDRDLADLGHPWRNKIVSARPVVPGAPKQ
jgi:hypothetical protein